jgi:hypothetical protein
MVAFMLGLAATLAALFSVGLGISRLTYRHALRSGLRQAVLGLLAAAITYGVGTLLVTRRALSRRPSVAMRTEPECVGATLRLRSEARPS